MIKVELYVTTFTGSVLCSQIMLILLKLCKYKILVTKVARTKQTSSLYFIMVESFFSNDYHKKACLCNATF